MKFSRRIEFTALRWDMLGDKNQEWFEARAVLSGVIRKTSTLVSATSLDVLRKWKLVRDFGYGGRQRKAPDASGSDRNWIACKIQALNMRRNVLRLASSEYVIRCGERIRYTV
jgi:hypothetical protein